MLSFFRRIRRNLANENQVLKYSRYAIGEIVLVVIGILIAIQINNWNENRKDKEKTNRLLAKVQKELLVNIKETDGLTGWFIARDSLFYKIQNNKATYEDYKSSSMLSNLIYRRWRVDITDDAYKQFMDFEGEIPNELDSIRIQLNEAYGADWVSIHQSNELMDDFVKSNLKEEENNKKWFADFITFGKRPDDMIEYQLKDTIYKNRVANFSLRFGEHFNRTREYRNKALNIYEEISDYLDLKKDTSVVKNIDNYRHYLGSYEDNRINAQIIRKDNILKVDLIAKNDTVIIASYRIYPYSKNYFIAAIGRNNSIGQLIFDEDDKVSKIIVSSAPHRSEMKKTE